VFGRDDWDGRIASRGFFALLFLGILVWPVLVGALKACNRTASLPDLLVSCCPQQLLVEFAHASLLSFVLDLREFRWNCRAMHTRIRYACGLWFWLGKFSLDPVVESRMQGFWHFGQKCLTDICLLGES
jgi:hypothetical protein